jgi:RNA polymerase sigma-70 factor, ECF subfamily
MNARTFQELHDACRHKVYFAVLGYVRNADDAEDLTAEAFAAAYRERKNFRAESSFFTWVYRIAMNAAHSARRRKRAVSLDAYDGPVPAALIQPDLLDRALDRDTCCRQLRMALKGLPGRYRRVLVNHFVRGHSTRQIAQTDRIPVGTVLSRLYTGRWLLRRAWDATDGALLHKGRR